MSGELELELWEALQRDNNLEKIKSLVKQGADINAHDEYYGQTALMFAKTAEYTQFLLDIGADINARDYDNMTALMYAKDAEQTQVLINAKADINARDYNQKTALMHARTLEQMMVLIENGIDIEARDDMQMTALMQADTLEKTMLLFHAGANINACDFLGKTVLMCAQTKEQVEFLLAAGVNMDAPAAFGGRTNRDHVAKIMLRQSIHDTEKKSKKRQSLEEKRFVYRNNKRRHSQISENKDFWLKEQDYRK